MFVVERVGMVHVSVRVVGSSSVSIITTMLRTHSLVYGPRDLL